MSPAARRAMPAVLLLAAMLLAYLPALSGGFVWDDDLLVTSNPNLRSAGGLARTWVDPRANLDYFPLTFTSWWLELRLFGLDPFILHLDNVLLHGACVLLLRAILAQLALPGAWLAAAIFALHPLHTESVAWVAQRKSVLSGALVLGAVLAFVRSAGIGVVPAARPRRARALSLALFTGAMLAKPVTMAAAAVLPLLLWLRRGRLAGADLRLVLPYFGLAVPMAMLTTWVQYAHVGAGASAFELSAGQRLMLAGRIPWFYAGKLAWPSALTFAYPRWELSVSWAAFLPAAGVAVLLGALALAARRLGRAPLVAALSYLALLTPALGLLNIYWHRYYYVADHVPYLASTSLIALGAGGAARLAAGLERRGRFAARLAAALVLGLLGVLTWRQSGIYRDEETVWRDTLRKDPASFMAHNNLGSIELRRGRLAEASRHYAEGISLNPALPEAQVNYGAILAELGRDEEARARFEEALRIEPGYPPAHFNLGNLFAAHGRLREAVEHYRQALGSRRGGDAETRYNLGLALAGLGRGAEAEAEYRAALRERPDYAEARTALGLALASRGRAEEAAAEFGRALALEPGQADAHYNLGSALAASGRAPEAAERFREALRLDPSHVEARNGLGLALEALGRPEEAMAQFREAIRIAPAHPRPHFNLGLALAGAGRAAEAVGHLEEAVRLTRRSEPEPLAALAAVAVAAGRPELAARAAREAAALARAQGRHDLAARIEADLAGNGGGGGPAGAGPGRDRDRVVR